MNKTFTYTDLLLFAYNETDLCDTVLIAKALENDPDLQLSFREIVNTMEYIEGLSKQPSDDSVEVILNYSRLTQPSLV